MSHDDADVEVELTVLGGLGPVLRRALRPCRVVRSRPCTTVRVTSVADVATVVAAVDSLGLELDGVYAVGAADRVTSCGETVASSTRGLPFPGGRV